MMTMLSNLSLLLINNYNEVYCYRWWHVSQRWVNQLLSLQLFIMYIKMNLIRIKSSLRQILLIFISWVHRSDVHFQCFFNSHSYITAWWTRVHFWQEYQCQVGRHDISYSFKKLSTIVYKILCKFRNQDLQRWIVKKGQEFWFKIMYLGTETC